ncbi:MAG: hypothetical protein OEW35_05490 [Gammaproteobacteria bacterium]|nr:hypothetical protein [Gammaproteobacteria bacterium]MDH4253070.1 hypothetical protein [Gammaproteobacteria bacterium]MDH5308896.1 hypothetical protein [Gammaproteobacteria bacterium]
MSHHEDDFFAAVSVLAGHGHIKERLVAAFEDNLQDIEPDDLSVSMKQTFNELRHLMMRVEPLNGEGPIRASVRKMSIREADECAQLMVELYADALRMGGTVQESLPLRGEEQPEVRGVVLKSV